METHLKKFSVLLALALLCISLQAEGIDAPKGKQIPDIPGYYTLKCDFHMHTVFSDGKVWPTVRVDEAIQEGLDAIALTDHIGKGKPDTDVIKNVDRAYEIAKESLENSELILIRGGEITFGTPPGHSNALFLIEVQKLVTNDSKVAFSEAKKQDAFFFWNHSNWKSPNSKWEQDGIAIWFDEHTELLNDGLMMGMEIVNGQFYNLEAHKWCLEKNLTMMANSDIHQPITFEYNLDTEHRPLTLVFAKERTAEGIKEALKERRTAVWFEDNIIGKEEFLTPVFQESVRVEKVSYHEKIAEVVLKNESAVDFILENAGEYSFLNKTRVMTLKAGEELRLGVKTAEILEQFQLKFKVLNMLITPEDYLLVEINCKTDK